MYRQIKFAGHPIHAMIVPFPIVLYTLSVIGFGVYQFAGFDAFWYRLGLFSTWGGLATAVLAAIPGIIDWSKGIPKGTAGHARGLLHLRLNGAAMILFIANAFQTWGTWGLQPASARGPFVVALLGVILTGFAAYHGAELIWTHKVGVAMTPEQEKLEPVGRMSRREHEISTPVPRPV